MNSKDPSSKMQGKSNEQTGGKPMESMDDKDYCIADLSNEEINKISELEKTISFNTNKDIVLIAYQTIIEAEK